MTGLEQVAGLYDAVEKLHETANTLSAWIRQPKCVSREKQLECWSLQLMADLMALDKVLRA